MEGPSMFRAHQYESIPSGLRSGGVLRGLGGNSIGNEVREVAWTSISKSVGMWWGNGGCLYGLVSGFLGGIFPVAIAGKSQAVFVISFRVSRL